MALLRSSWIKYFLTRLGAFLPARAIYRLKASIGYLELRRWMRARGYGTRRRFSRREELFDLLGQQVRDREVQYLEFGVFQGEATRYWSKTPAELEEQAPRVRQLRRTAGELAPRSSERLFRHPWRNSADDNRVTFSRDGSTRLYGGINVRRMMCSLSISMLICIPLQSAF